MLGWPDDGSITKASPCTSAYRCKGLHQRHKALDFLDFPHPATVSREIVLKRMKNCQITDADNNTLLRIVSESNV